MQSCMCFCAAAGGYESSQTKPGCVIGGRGLCLQRTQDMNLTNCGTGRRWRVTFIRWLNAVFIHYRSEQQQRGSPEEENVNMNCSVSHSIMVGSQEKDQD